MGIILIILTSIGLAMDAFAIALCKGLSIKRLTWKKAIVIAFYFGFFQFIMPLIGYLLGITFQSLIINIDHWVAFILLSLIGLNMIKEAFSRENKKITNEINFRIMLPLAIATSIDALTVGITFTLLQFNIFIASVSIGVITFAISLIGVKIGNIFGNKFEKKSQLLGGYILILIGFKILLSHLGVI